MLPSLNSISPTTTPH
ncbi:hypothetical protein Ahy_A05g022765 isoform B [Arachis hypogaea]|uniref:Uncharacterized protein n=1 Tax=Arachis hypogaea TaxID=3818 RepID=A0A445D1J2_ARAHY|nr:hypothetical protein Ahy_A05g022765 isoform B [Arachis hypogaea]